MKKVGIITLFNNINYGNRLQNYALQVAIEKLGLKCETVINYDLRIIKLLKNHIKKLLKPTPLEDKLRMKNFDNFNKLINCSKKKVNNNKIKLNLNYDYYVTGSDQVWNPQFCKENRLKFNLLSFAPENVRISYAASFGISKIDKNEESIFKNELKKFKKISVREEAGYEIIKKIDSNIECNVVVDPTLLISSSEWEKIELEPNNFKNEKYILAYFLGGINDSIKSKINSLAIKHNCKIIDLLDKKNEYYTCGPQEFLYLIRNSFMICTDSFHACVFSFLFNKPFIVFERVHIGYLSMNSRIDSFLNTFKLSDRKFSEEIVDDKYLDFDYSFGYKILNEKKKEGYNFLEEALDIKSTEGIDEY